MKNIFKYIISSHYLSIIISLLFVSLSTLEYLYINKIIDEKLSVKKEDIVTIESKEETIKEEPIEENNLIYVDVKGEVKKPGVYEISNNSRVSDVIELSGGLTKNANTRFINLSKQLNDGDVIVIYSNNEIKNATKVKKETIYIETPCVCEEVKNDACLVENLNIEEPINETKNETIVNNSKININTATKEELMSLSGIGEAKAISIIEYRESNGPFKDIKDITNVKGISESIYVKIKENITI